MFENNWKSLIQNKIASEASFSLQFRFAGTILVILWRENSNIVMANQQF